MNPVEIESIEVFHSAFNAGFRYIGSVRSDFDGLGEISALETAFERTNSIEVPWYENDDVIVSDSVALAGGARSTSVDDYMLVNSKDPSINPKWFRVSAFGFEEVYNEDVVRLLSVDDAGHRIEELTFEMLKRRRS